ncbi:fructose-2,6-bisphosphatase [Martiniozyma asiatica (nom. inval.)]|nr:fructose-2,6-bisphosphatase [Martiniozyma asiatica]
MSPFVLPETPLRLCVVLVGLPARGKSFIAHKLVRYFSWLSVPTKSFDFTTQFSPADLDVQLTRDQLNQAAVDSLHGILSWLDSLGDSPGVVIYDGPNVTVEDRQLVSVALKDAGVDIVFLESFCDDESLISGNILTNARKSNINHDYLASIYQPLSLNTGSDLSFIKLINFSDQIILNKIDSYLKSRIVYYIMNLHVKPRYIWLSRHGESMYNLEGKIGGDASLSPRGFKYAEKLKSLVEEYIPNSSQLQIWTSTLIRTKQTSQYLPHPKKSWKALDELDAGSCDGLTYEEIAEQFPDDFKARDDNKFEYRYPGGESYRDVITRLEPIIMALENQENVLVITHQAVLRCIYAYFVNVSQEESPWMSIPLHTLIRLEIGPNGTQVTRIKADIPAVSTYKEKGTSKLGESKDGKNRLEGEVISST